VLRALMMLSIGSVRPRSGLRRFSAGFVGKGMTLPTRGRPITSSPAILCPSCVALTARATLVGLTKAVLFGGVFRGAIRGGL